MKCEVEDCHSPATEKHHTNYFPEVTVGVCAFHGDDIHENPDKYPDLLQYKKGDASAIVLQRLQNQVTRTTLISKA